MNIYMGLFCLFASLFFLSCVSSVKDVPKFICENGDSIDANAVCDGFKHCPDGSDELRSACRSTVCTSQQYQCFYGACVANSSRCDGTVQCADGSDEKQCGKANDCRQGEFKCTSGECLSFTQICEEKVHCKDNSDQEASVCEKADCPLDTYRCNIGGCINLDLRCNGRNDCIDGSDEAPSLCQNLKCSTGMACNQGKNQTTCPPIAIDRMFARCRLLTGKDTGRFPCDKPLPVGTVVDYRCKQYYVPATTRHRNNKKMICQDDGTWNREVLKCEPECGKAEPDAVSLIVKGWGIHQVKTPWHAVLYLLEAGNWVFICGSTLITEKVILTAAHCVWETMPQNLRVVAGHSYSDYNKMEEHAVVRDVVRVIQHPLYQDVIGDYGSDIAILVLNSSVELSPSVRPACIDWNLDDISDHLRNTTLGLVVGLGATENAESSDRLKATYLPVVGDEECIKSETRDFKKYITFTSFCAGWGNGTGVCNGDSGGGLVFHTDKNINRWTLQGIVSVSPRLPNSAQCDPRYFTVFTKVGMYVRWIYKTLQTIHSDVMHYPFSKDW